MPPAPLRAFADRLRRFMAEDGGQGYRADNESSHSAARGAAR